MKVILTTKNLGKTEAVKKVIDELFPGSEVIGIKVDSGVSATPMSDDEGIKGALNRIKNAKKEIPDADMYLGLEGILMTNSYGSFICGWAVVDFVTKNRLGLGCGARVKLPDKIKVDNYEELSQIIKNKYPSEQTEKMHLIAANGVISNGLYTRIHNFTDALHSAFGYILNDANW